MPTTPSAKKRLRQTKVRSEANRIVRSRMRTYEKRLLQSVEAGDKEGAKALLPKVQQALDKAARRRVVHPNTASNHMARLARKVQQLG